MLFGKSKAKEQQQEQSAALDFVATEFGHDANVGVNADANADVNADESERHNDRNYGLTDTMPMATIQQTLSAPGVAVTQQQRDSTAVAVAPQRRASLIIKKATLMRLLQVVAGVVEKRQTLPILANVLMVVENGVLTVTGSDSELEVTAKTALSEGEAANNFTAITLPGRKLADICRSLFDGSVLEISIDMRSERVTFISGGSRFVLTTLPARDFPIIPAQKNILEFDVNRSVLGDLAGKVCFVIPQQHVRSYLNGMLLEVQSGTIKVVATDSARLAMSFTHFSGHDQAFAQVILPRKAVMEIVRFLSGEKEKNSEMCGKQLGQHEVVTVGLNSNYIKVSGENFAFTSRLIAGKYPNYNNLIPKGGNKHIVVNRSELKQALQRINILANEMLHNFRLILESGVLRLFANNPEQEEAVEELAVNYEGDKLDIVFNIEYLVGILNNIDGAEVKITFKDESGAIIRDATAGNDTLYVLMPIL